MQVFYKATNPLFDFYYLTLHSLFGILLNCSLVFLKFRSINNFEIIINEFLPKWNKYFRNILCLNVIIAITYLRVKQGVKNVLIRYHANM